MAEQVRIDVTAKDDASKTLDKVADKVDELEHAEVAVPVDADTTKAGRDIDGLMTKVDKLTADAATILLTSNAGQIAGDIAGLIGDLDRLDASDPEVTVKADQINSLKGDLDRIEAKVKEVNAVPVDVDTAPARHNIDEVAKSAGSSKSVLANMVGNTTQDLGALGGVAGSAGVAIGQMGEYMADAAAEGEGLGSVLKNFAGVAGPIAAISLGVALFTREMAKAQQTSKEMAEQVDSFYKAIRGGEGILAGFVDQVRETGTLKFPGIGDILPDLDQLNLSVKQFADLAKLPRPQLEAWAAAQGKLGEGSGALYDVMLALDEANTNNAKANERNRITTEALAGVTSDAAENTKALNAAYADAADSSTAYADAQQRGADMLDRVNKLLLDQASALADQADAATTAADAQLDENDALATYSDTLKDANASTNDVRDAAIALAKAHVTTAEAQAKARGETITATQKIDAQNDALLQTASTAKGEARKSILQYIGSVNQIPPSKLTEILALIDQGKLDEAKWKLAEASAPRTAAVTADANTAQAESDLGPNGLTRPRTVDIYARVRAPSFPGSGQAPGPAPSAAAVVTPTVVTPTVGVVNLRLPVGWRGDPLAEVHRATRRNGRHYQRLAR